MTPRFPVFDARIATHYEAWYTTPAGERADALERAALWRLLLRFPDARTVLEVGAGTGHFTRWFRAQGRASVGLDLSRPMLSAAKDLNGVALVQADATHLPFAPDTFDVVALITTLEFLPDPESALAAALRVARQGILLGVLNRCSPLGLTRRLQALLRPSIYSQGRFYSVGELERLVRSVVGASGQLHWETTLFPRWWPTPALGRRWGGFVAMAWWIPGTNGERSV